MQHDIFTFHFRVSRVFPLPIFEVDTTVSVPRDKTELQELLRTNKAIPFHKRVCASCHGIPKSKEWMAANETDGKSPFFCLFLSLCGYGYNIYENIYLQNWEYFILANELDILYIGSQFLWEHMLILITMSD